MEPPKLLIVDDEPRIREFFVRFFSAEGWVVSEAEDGIDAQEALLKESFDVMVTDLKMPRMDGIELLKWANVRHPDMQKIILTAFSSVNAAVSAVREGAYDFISKPIDNFEKLRITIQRAYDTKKLRLQNTQLIGELQSKNKELTDRLSELQVAYDLMKEQSKVLDDDLITARKIQFHLLPRHFPVNEEVTFASFYQPSRNVGGDIFDVIQIDDDNIVAYIADASGHGVSSAMMAVFVKQLVKAFRMEQDHRNTISPAEVLTYLNNMIFQEDIYDTVFVTMLYTHLDLRNKKAHISTAGHPPLIIRRSDGRIEQTGCHCPALGIQKNSEFVVTTIDVSEGDILLMYTDGITDCEDEKGRSFGKQGIIQSIASSGKSASEVYHCLVNNLKECMAEHPQEDDMSLLLCGFMNEEITTDRESIAPSISLLKRSDAIGHNHITYKQIDNRLYFVVRGKGSWKESRPLLKSFKEAMGREIAEVVVDLSKCEYLDSTFLGTLQKITEVAGQKENLNLLIQNVPDKIMKILDELVMEDVIGKITSEPLPVPETMREITIGMIDREEYAGHILETHELLSRLSEKNREKFQLLVETLRKTSTRNISNGK